MKDLTWKKELKLLMVERIRKTPRMKDLDVLDSMRSGRTSITGRTD